MNPCKDCIVDMICTTKCPIFEVDLDRLQTDELIYTKRCMNNIKNNTYKNTYKISENGGVDISVDHIRWFRDGNTHRDNDQPALISYDGSQSWYKNGKCHRDNDQPAVTWIDGDKFWYKNGVYHRLNNKPALILADGTQRWYKDGVRYEPM